MLSRFTSSRHSATRLLIATGVGIVSAAIFSIAAPELRPMIFLEDGPVEWASVAAFAAVAALGVRKHLRGASADIVLLVVTGFGLLAALDELSFGERIFGFEFPRIMGTKLDAAHDLIMIGQKFIKRTTDHPYLVGIAALLVAAGFAAALFFLLHRRGLKVVPGREFALVVGAVGCLAFAQGIDTNLEALHLDRLEDIYLEEVLELAAGILLLGFVIQRPRDAVIRDKAHRAPA